MRSSATFAIFAALSAVLVRRWRRQRGSTGAPPPVEPPGHSIRCVRCLVVFDEPTVDATWLEFCSHQCHPVRVSWAVWR